MRKIAFFVEGNTEFAFLRLFLRFFLDINHIEISNDKKHKNVIIVEAHSKNTNYYISINNCGADNRIVSELRDAEARLLAEGFENAVLLRDAHPTKKSKVPLLEQGIKKEIKKLKIPTTLILAIMEIEAWFLAEYTHMAKIDRQLTPEFIKKYRGYDLRHYNVEKIEKPSDELKDIYKLVKRGYNKSPQSINKVIKNLDFKLLTSELSKKYKSIHTLIAIINSYISANNPQNHPKIDK